MPESIPEDFVAIFKQKSFAHLATLMPDGSPQVSPVWIDYDGEYILVNSAKGRIKDRNMEARPQVSLSVLDPDNSYRYVMVRGTVVEILEEGAENHIDALAQRYFGREKYGLREGEVRRIYKIRPDHIVAHG
ncbi:MAG: PPOX class F420-dependent oxidoreductase [Chloroflexi bacterium]|nr:PPOX class F420-dependent oxidoreductase [Chloroflexota bacterium]